MVAIEPRPQHITSLSSEEQVRRTLPTTHPRMDPLGDPRQMRPWSTPPPRHSALAMYLPTRASQPLLAEPLCPEDNLAGLYRANPVAPYRAPKPASSNFRQKQSAGPDAHRQYRNGTRASRPDQRRPAPPAQGPPRAASAAATAYGPSPSPPTTIALASISVAVIVSAVMSFGTSSPIGGGASPPSHLSQ